MTKNFSDKIEELERRIMALEARPIYYPVYIQPQQPTYPQPPFYPNTGTPLPPFHPTIC